MHQITCNTKNNRLNFFAGNRNVNTTTFCLNLLLLTGALVFFFLFIFTFPPLQKNFERQ